MYLEPCRPAAIGLRQRGQLGVPGVSFHPSRQPTQYAWPQRVTMSLALSTLASSSAKHTEHSSFSIVAASSACFSCRR